MTIQEDIEILEAEKRRLFKEHIAPIEDKIQIAYRQLNESKTEVDLTKVDIESIKSKYYLIDEIKTVK